MHIVKEFVINALLYGLSSTVFFAATAWLFRNSFAKYLETYSSEKGKTRARTEDIDRLTAVEGALTKVTETIKTEFARQTEAMKHEHQKELEETRRHVQVMFSRVSKVHEKEFEVLPQAWFMLHEACGSAHTVAVGTIRYPDFRTMPEPQFEEFLKGSNLTTFQQDSLRNADDRWKFYINLKSEIYLNEASEKHRLFNNYLIQNRIFMTDELQTAFGSVAKDLSEGLIDYSFGMQGNDRKLTSDGRKKLIGVSEKISQVERAVQKRLHYEEA